MLYWSDSTIFNKSGSGHRDGSGHRHRTDSGHKKGSSSKQRHGSGGGSNGGDNQHLVPKRQTSRTLSIQREGSGDESTFILKGIYPKQYANKKLVSVFFKYAGKIATYISVAICKLFCAKLKDFFLFQAFFLV